MALTDRSIVTLNELKSYLNITTSDTTKDTFLETIIDKMSGEVEEGIDSAVAPQDTEEILDGTGSKTITLESYAASLVGATDAAKLANFQYREDPTDAWVDITDDMDNISIDGKTITILGSTSSGDYVTTFPIGRKNIRIQYYAGFDPVPASLWTVCLEKCAWHFKESTVGGGLLGQTSGSMGLGGGSHSATYKEMESRWNKVYREFLGDMPNVTVINI